jgi:hypothetical protein
VVDAEAKKWSKAHALGCSFSNSASQQYANGKLMSVFGSSRLGSVTLNASLTVNADENRHIGCRKAEKGEWTERPDG